MGYTVGLGIGFVLGLLAAIIYAGLSASSDDDDAFERRTVEIERLKRETKGRL